MRELSLFTGAGGGLLATKHLLGWRQVGYVEIDEYCQRLLAQRIKEGYLDEAPIFTDVREFVESGAAREYRGFADVVTGGFPCQDISVAGRGRGLAGGRSQLWFAMLRTVEEIRPRFVFAENSPALRTRGLQDVSEGLARLGYDPGWGVLGAGDIGAPHIRRRMWIRSVADPCGTGRREDASSTHEDEGSDGWRSALQADEPGGDGERCGGRNLADSSGGHGLEIHHRWWDTDPADPGSAFESRVGRVADGVAHRMDRLRALGNGQVPAVAAAAWEVLR